MHRTAAARSALQHQGSRHVPEERAGGIGTFHLSGSPLPTPKPPPNPKTKIKQGDGGALSPDLKGVSSPWVADSRWSCLRGEEGRERERERERETQSGGTNHTVPSASDSTATLLARFRIRGERGVLMSTVRRGWPSEVPVLRRCQLQRCKDVQARLRHGCCGAAAVWRDAGCR